MAARSRCTVVSLTEWGSTFATTMTVSSRPSGESPVEVLRVHEHGVVLARVEADVAQLAERRVRVADAVQDAEVERQRAPLLLGGGEVAGLELVLLVVDRLFGAGRATDSKRLEAE